MEQRDVAVAEADQVLDGDDETDLNFDVPRVRILAFQDVMTAAGLEVRRSGMSGETSRSERPGSFRRLWGQPVPADSIFCASDEWPWASF